MTQTEGLNMLRTILGAAVGLLVGAGLGAGLAFVMHLSEEPSGWTSYPTLGQMSAPTVMTPFTSYLFSGILFGGGAGAIVGAITGSTGALLRAMKAMTAHEPPPPATR
jgi:hypothetical protein